MGSIVAFWFSELESISLTGVDCYCQGCFLSSRTSAGSANRPYFKSGTCERSAQVCVNVSALQKCTHTVSNDIRILPWYAPLSANCSSCLARGLRYLLLATMIFCATFDAMSRDLMADALIARGCTPQLACVFLRELTGIQAVYTLPGAGTTEPFAFEKGAKQGVDFYWRHWSIPGKSVASVLPCDSP